MIANILGLGSAATPAGLKAMEELAEIKKEKDLPEEVASNEMCTFLILNISSLQLIPVSVSPIAVSTEAAIPLPSPERLSQPRW